MHASQISQARILDYVFVYVAANYCHCMMMLPYFVFNALSIYVLLRLINISSHIKALEKLSKHVFVKSFSCLLLTLQKRTSASRQPKESSNYPHQSLLEIGTH